MIRIHVTGPLDLRDAEGRPLGAMPSQPKRSGLLAYLAAATPRGFHRRDTLFAIFWPEHDTQSARNALNTSVSYLRGILGAQALARRGAGELALASDHVWCDVWAIDDALRDDRLEDALALYRGDLLEGFHVSGVPEFERWLDRERERLRVALADAAWTLAERAEADGRTADVARWARRAVAFTPNDEVSLRRLIECLHRNGDSAGALREYDEFARRLREELDVEPSARTRELVDAIRARPVAPAPRPVAQDGAASAPAPPALPPEDPAPAPGFEPSAERVRGPSAHSAPTSRPRRLVLAALFALAMLVAFKLLREPVAVGAREPVEQPEPGGPAPVVETLPRTASFDAFDNYRAGVVAGEHGDFETAVERLKVAVALDPDFALAHLRLSMAGHWVGDTELARWAADRAIRNFGGLDRWLLGSALAWRAYLSGAPLQAERLAHGVLEDNVDGSAYTVLAEVLFHWYPMLGRSATLSRTEWEQSLAFPMERAAARIHLARIAASERDRGALEEHAGWILERDLPRDNALILEARALLAFTGNDAEARRRVIDDVATAEATALATLARAVAVFAQDLEGADQLTRLALTRLAPTTDRDHAMAASIVTMLAQTHAAAGRLDAAASTLHDAAELPAERAVELLAAWALAPLPPVADARLAALRREIDATPEDAFIGPGMSYFTAEGIYPPRRRYLLGRLSLEIGDLDAVRRIVVELENDDARTPMDRRYQDYFARLLRAELARADGNSAAALEALGEPDIPASATLPDLLDYPRAHERWLRAELLRELGRHDAAHAWYATFPDPQGYDLAYLAASHLRRAELLEAQGESDAAAIHLTRFSDLREPASSQ